MGFDERLALIAERHIGAGITKEEAIELGLPPKDYLPVTLEEKIVAHADNLIFGTERVEIDAVIKKFEKRLDPRNRPYYWYGRLEQGNGETGTDIDALMNNYISITPVQCDNTDYTTINELERRILFQLL